MKKLLKCFLIAGIQVSERENTHFVVRHNDAHHLVPVYCCLRLWYYFSKGKYGFRCNKDRAEKELSRITKINPDLSEDDVKNMKMELINLLDGETFKIVPQHQRKNVDDEVHAPPHVPTKQPITVHELQFGNNDLIKNATVISSVEYEKSAEGTSANHNSDDITTVISSVEYGETIDDISEITGMSTGMSSINNDRAKTKAPFEPMKVLPENTSASVAADSTTSHTTTQQTSTTQNQPVSGSNEGIRTSANESNQRVKPCFDCNRKRPQDCFTSSQWRKTNGSGKCIDCVSKCLQWQTSNITTATLQLKLCCGCRQKKKHADFSQSQWRRNVGTGRCRACVEKGLL